MSELGFRYFVLGLGFRVSGLGFGFKGLGRIWSLLLLVGLLLTASASAGKCPKHGWKCSLSGVFPPGLSPSPAASAASRSRGPRWHLTSEDAKGTNRGAHGS